MRPHVFTRLGREATMRFIRHRFVLLYVLMPLLLVGSCVNPVCGCSPLLSGIEVEGTLRTAADAPVAGFRVRAEVAHVVLRFT